MEFIDIKKGAYLSAQQMNDIYNNFLYLKETLENAGFTVGEIVDNSVDASIDPIDIMAKFNAVETNIQKIHNVFKPALGTTERYYKEFTWQAWPLNRKLEVWRWIDWLYNVKNISIFYEALLDINGEPITDINGEQILVLAAKEEK